MEHSWATPGAKAVCIVDDPSQWYRVGHNDRTTPQFMNVYTIREQALRYCGGLGCTGHVTLMFEEFPQDAFDIRGFAPVQDMPDEEDELTAPPKQPIDA